MLSTRITEQYELEVPFVCAGMGFVGMPPLVAAVSEAGGMGTLRASPMPRRRCVPRSARSAR